MHGDVRRAGRDESQPATRELAFHGRRDDRVDPLLDDGGDRRPRPAQEHVAAAGGIPRPRLDGTEIELRVPLRLRLDLRSLCHDGRAEPENDQRFLHSPSCHGIVIPPGAGGYANSARGGNGVYRGNGITQRNEATETNGWQTPAARNQSRCFFTEGQEVRRLAVAAGGGSTVRAAFGGPTARLNRIGRTNQPVTRASSCVRSDSAACVAFATPVELSFLRALRSLL